MTLGEIEERIEELQDIDGPLSEREVDELAFLLVERSTILEDLLELKYGSPLIL